MIEYEYYLPKISNIAYDILNEYNVSNDFKKSKVLSIGENTIILKPFFEAENLVLVYTREKEKYYFLYRLSKIYNFHIEKYKEGFLLSEMKPIILTNKKDISSLVSFSKKYKTLSNLSEKSLFEIQNIPLRNIVKESLSCVKENTAFLDLHALQFVEFEKKIICIDPVYYDLNSF